MVFQTIEAFLDMLEAHPDEAVIRDNGKEAIVYNTERKAFLLLKGDFVGLPDEIAWELRQALYEQHPLPETPT